METKKRSIRDFITTAISYALVVVIMQALPLWLAQLVLFVTFGAFIAFVAYLFWKG